MATRSIRLKEWTFGVHKMKPKPEYIAKCKDNILSTNVMDKPPCSDISGYWSNEHKITKFYNDTKESISNRRNYVQLVDYRNFLITIKSICDLYKINLILCTSVNMSSIHKILHSINSYMRKVADILDIDIIDYEKFMQDNNVFYDGHHLSISGAEQYDKIAYQHIKKYL